MDAKKELQELTFIEKSAANVSESLREGFGYLGHAVGLRPWLTIAGALFCVIALGAGLTQLTVENRGDKLWVPTDTQAQDDKAYVEDHYARSARIAISVVHPTNDDGDLLTPEAFDVLYKLHQQIIVVEATHDGTLYKYTDLCERRGANCSVRGILEIFEYDESKWDTREKILATVNSEDTRTISGDRLDVSQVLGGLSYDSSDQIVGAKASETFYFMQNNEEKKNGGFEDPIEDAWEQAFLDRLLELKDENSYPNYELERFASRSFSDEFGSAIRADLVMLQLAIFVNIIYAVTMTSKWSRGRLGVRCLLIISSVLSVGLAIVASYGLLSACGLFYSPLMGVLPFLMLGIGIDDAFVLIHQLDMTDPGLSTPDRLKTMLMEAGPSITLTSMTDFFAFMIGANTSLPALRYFCIYAAVGILFDFILQVTFFVACMAVDVENKRKGYADCCWYSACCRRDLEQVSGATVCGCNREEKEPLLMTFMTYKLGGALKDKRVKAAVCAFFLCTSAVGIYGSVMIGIESDVTDFIPAGSYIWNFIDVTDEYFTSVGDACAIYVEDGVDYTQSTTWAGLNDLYADFQTTEYVAASTTDSWFEQFSKRYNFTGENFYSQLNVFLANDGANYNGTDIIWSDGLIFTSRMRGNHDKLNNTGQYIDSMDNLRDSVSKVEYVGDKAFAYGPNYLNYEQYKSIRGEAIMNLTLAMLAVSFIVTVLVVHPVASLLVICSVGLVVVDVVGFMYLWGLSIDSVTVVMLVVALGLSVDYSAHVGHAFMHKQGTPDERMVAALRDMGTAVFNGAMSTFLAVMVLAGSLSYVFATFFKQLFLCTTFGMAHGLILLPVLLSIAGPSAAPPPSVKPAQADKLNAVEMQPKEAVSTAVPPTQLEAPGSIVTSQ